MLHHVDQFDHGHVHVWPRNYVGSPRTAVSEQGQTICFHEKSIHMRRNIVDVTEGS
ncbi:hypothetical protein PNO31109_01750 [Pandoraea nosoerga]|uniref:Uncharacterized protein n=1 Tax=Pandoraea nosoerga TaxID=2508296 RepID=A0A5E4U0W4_9BURK|nr:hypothetical protein PNO31109_01750 [Pandoraea nosoerga]